MKHHLCLVFVLGFAAWVCGLFAEPLPPLPEGAVTLAVIPDTQRHSGEGKRVKPGQPAAKGTVRNNAFVSCVDWLLANQRKERIFFVSHTGDIVDNLNDFQMTFAAAASRSHRPQLHVDAREVGFIEFLWQRACLI